MVIYRKKVQVKDPITHRYHDIPLLREPLSSHTNAIFHAITSCSTPFLVLLFTLLLTLPRLFYNLLYLLYSFFSNPCHYTFAQLFLPPLPVFDPVP